MRCNICDRLLNESVFNRDLGTYEPCPTCLEVIHDTVASFYDRPSADEDEISPSPLGLHFSLDNPDDI